MNIFVLEKRNRGTTSVPVGEAVVRPANLSCSKSIIKTVLAALCCSFFAIGPAHGQTEGADPPSAPIRVLPSPVILPPGTYQGVWRDDAGLTGEWRAVLKVDGKSITGKLMVYGVEDYSGDKIRGKTVENEDGTLGVEFKTRDRKWKSKAIFDGQFLIGTFYYEFQDRRIQRLRKGEWAAQRVSDDT
jgi:hypothetical protein